MSRPHAHAQEDEEGILGTGIRTRDIELLGRKITTTANHLLATTTETTQTTYNQAFAEIHRELRRPGLQRSVFSFAKSSPKELIRSTVSTTEIQQRALSYIPDDLLKDVPSSETRYSLFQGFEASVPEHDEDEEEVRPKHHGHRKSQKLIEGVKKLEIEDTPSSGLTKLKKERDKTARKLEMMGVRKNMCSVEITEIDRKIANLNIMRKIVLDRLSGLEEEEVESEQQLTGLDYKIEDLAETIREAEERAAALTPPESVRTGPTVSEEPQDPMMAPEVDTFMSASIYEKLPSSRTPKRGRPTRRISTPIRHGHLGPGALIRELPGHNDIITSLDFDLPFGTMVSAALDDTVRVWDLHNGRCLGLLEGHLASVRCLQVEDNLVATGSIDATIRLWDLNKTEIVDPPGKFNTETILEEDEDEIDEYENVHRQGYTNVAAPAAHSSMADCPVFTLEAHVSEITALHFHKDTLVSGSADKTMRQWDLTTGRCVQTLDVLWAAAQAAANMPSASAALTPWRTAGRLPVGEADFIGALQCFDAALACATADGMVRLWDLRSGQVSRSLVGHTEPVTCLQFDDTHLVTGSLDRSIRIWDLRTGMLHDAFTFDNPITSMMFDSRRIVAATGEPVVKVFDKTDGKTWDCGDGSGSIVERVRVKDGFLLGGKRDGSIGVWAC